ncbi:transglycosylase-like protein with SLT domain [Actinomycetospora succinea]|uniref:Transglycosylase-like protein with SLT domain n=1 Tax=Actinomycetospora succinea TaxID=663603 RepID=A0A4R6VET1_9PSEU|nr:transglycosylase SLT domain-containing protein [Actinomycetospora succinea]TDQ55607.1 transglycosylase-like protein with SLT domain [Actinomycetospora succinea]
MLAVGAGCAEAPAAPAVPTPAAVLATDDSSDVVGPHGPTVPDEPVALARVLEDTQATIADPARPPDDVASAGRTAQVAYEELAFRPERLAPVLAALSPRVRESTERIVGAGRDLLSMAKRGPGEMLPAWRIAAPLPPGELRAAFGEAEGRFGVPWTVLAAVNLVESRMGRIASHSEAGARGPMQFMPSTWAGYGLGGDVTDPHDAILGAANYLRANGGATDAGLDRALKRYNNDDRYVRAVRAYAAVMQADERAYLGFHAWEVYFRTTAGRVHLPVGYDEAQAVRAVDYLAR